eukprot:657087-Rhodomonas_salina.6
MVLPQGPISANFEVWKERRRALVPGTVPIVLGVSCYAVWYHQNYMVRDVSKQALWYYERLMFRGVSPYASRYTELRSCKHITVRTWVLREAYGATRVPHAVATEDVRDIHWYRMLLRACYAMSGTDARMLLQTAGLIWRYQPTPPTRGLCDVRY